MNLLGYPGKDLFYTPHRNAWGREDRLLSHSICSSFPGWLESSECASSLPSPGSLPLVVLTEVQGRHTLHVPLTVAVSQTLLTFLKYGVGVAWVDWCSEEPQVVCQRTLWLLSHWVNTIVLDQPLLLYALLFLKHFSGIVNITRLLCHKLPILASVTFPSPITSYNPSLCFSPWLPRFPPSCSVLLSFLFLLPSFLSRLLRREAVPCLCQHCSGKCISIGKLRLFSVIWICARFQQRSMPWNPFVDNHSWIAQNKCPVVVFLPCC